MIRHRTAGLHAGLLAGLVFALALAWGGAQHDGYDHALRSVGLLGAAGAPGAAAFNVAAFVVPGALLATFAIAFAWRLRDGGSTLAARLGVHLGLISALAFAAQGLLPPDANEPDSAASKYHVFALTIAMIAAVPSMVLLGAGLRRRAAWRPLPQLGPAFAALLLVALAWPAHEWMPGWAGRSGFSQRLALLVYFSWPALASLVAMRRQPPL